MKLIVSGIVVSGLCAVGPATAALTTYTDEATFLANAGTTVMESFENIAVTPGATLLPGFAASELDNHFDVDGFSSGFQIWDDPAHATDGDQAMFWLAQNPTPFPNNDDKSFTLSNFDALSASITALGMYIVDWSTAPATGTLTFSNDNGESVIVAESPPSLPDWETFFFGVISDVPFTSGTLTTNTDDGWHLIDEVHYSVAAAAAPEPATLFLLAVGGIGVLGNGVRRRAR
jgi:hypothetical protein